MTTKTITDASFTTDVLEADGPVLVDFWAPWCGPCKQIAPSLEAISQENSAIAITKMDIDENPDFPGKFGVRGVPTMMIFKDGEVLSTAVGARPKTAIEAWISETIGSETQQASA